MDTDILNTWSEKPGKTTKTNVTDGVNVTDEINMADQSSDEDEEPELNIVHPHLFAAGMKLNVYIY